jgi:putative ABC transport system permease protein
MKSRDLLELAGRNLREAALRNSLTTLGIAVGVASLVAMLSLGVGLQLMINKRLARSGLFNAVFVSQQQNMRGFGEPRGPDRDNTPNVEPHVLDDSTLRQLEKIPNVVEANPDIRFGSEVRFGGKSRAAFLTGVPPSAVADDAFEGMKGRFFSGPKANEAIVQVEYARQLASDPASVIGQELTLRYAERQPLSPDKQVEGSPAAGWGFTVIPRERTLRIVGLIETTPGIGGGSFGRGGVFIPLDLAKDLRSIQGSDLRSVLRSNSDSASLTSYSNATVRVRTPEQVAAVEEAIKQMGYGAFSLLDATRNLRRVFAVIDLFLGIFGSLALAVASLGIINTLVMAILERRREIGILKALGAGDHDVRRLFFAEAGSMGVIGGAAGVLLGWLMGLAINFGTNVYLRRQGLPAETVCAVPWWLVAGAIAFSVLVSLAAGLYPASRAARLNPVEALRYE